MKRAFGLHEADASYVIALCRGPYAALSLLFLVLLLGALSGSFAAEGPLDGLRYTIDFAANKDDPPDRPAGSNALEFSQGLGSCVKAVTACGYKPIMCQASQQKKVMSFIFSMESPKHGLFTISGQIDGIHITGTRTWPKP